MLFKVKEEDIFILIEQFLKTKQLYGSLRSLEKDTSIVLGNLTEDAMFVREMVMEGEWDNLMEYLNPVRENKDYNSIRLMIEKQRYLELLATEKGSYDAGAVMKRLSILEELIPTRHEYTSLCYLLTKPHLKQHPAYANWNHYQARSEVFAKILELLKSLLGGCDDRIPTRNRLIDLLTKGLFYESCLKLCSQKLAPGGIVNLNDTICTSLLECEIADKEAILIHWLNEIPPSALSRPTKPRKVVEVEVEKAKTKAPMVTQSATFDKSREEPPRGDEHVYSSINRSILPLKTLPDTLTDRIVDDVVTSDVEKVLGDSEVAVKHSSTEDHLPLLDPPFVTESEGEPDKTKVQEDEALAASLLGLEMGFKDSHLVGTKDKSTTSRSADLLEPIPPISNGPPAESTITSLNRPKTTPDLLRNSIPEELLSQSREQEVKIRWLQQQLNQLRVEQDSLRRSAAISKVVKSYTPLRKFSITHASLPPLAPAEPPHTSIMTPPQGDGRGGTGGTGAGTGAGGDFEIIPIHGDDVPPEHIMYPLVQNRRDGGVGGVAITENGSSGSTKIHSHLADRGSGPDTKRSVAKVSYNGTVETPSSFQTLDSFSEDSLRPPKTSTPVAPLYKNKKIVDTSMLRVKFAPVGVLEDVQPIRAVAFHPAGELLAIGSNSKALRVASCHMISESVQTLPREDGLQDLPILFKRNNHHKGSLYTVAWNKQGNLLASGSNDKVISVINFDADNCISVGNDREFYCHQGTVRDIHFLDDRIMASVGGGDNLLHVTDVEKGVELSQFKGHTDALHCVTSYRTFLATGSADSTIRLWDRRSNTCVKVLGAAIGTQGAAGVTSITVNNFGNLMCASREDGLCMLYDIDYGSLLQAFTPHSSVTCRSVQFYRNPRYVLSGSDDGTLALTSIEQVLSDPDVTPTEIIGTHRDKVIKAAWHPIKQAFATASADRTVCLWSAKDGVDD